MLRVSLVSQLDTFRIAPVFELKAGFTALFGPSGAGKTTTLSFIAGLSTPQQGRIELGEHVLFDSETACNLPPQERNIGY